MKGISPTFPKPDCTYVKRASNFSFQKLHIHIKYFKIPVLNPGKYAKVELLVKELYKKILPNFFLTTLFEKFTKQLLSYKIWFTWKFYKITLHENFTKQLYLTILHANFT